MKWEPIESAPLIELGDSPQTCLVYGNETGVQTGRVWRYASGEFGALAFGFHGDWNLTHWMPLPEPPEAT